MTMMIVSLERAPDIHGKALRVTHNTHNTGAVSLTNDMRRRARTHRERERERGGGAAARELIVMVMLELQKRQSELSHFSHGINYIV